MLERLKTDPSSITPDDARRLHEHFEAKDERSARLISAIEAWAAAHDDITIADAKGPTETFGQGHASLHTLVQDLTFAVDKNPNDVTGEVLKLTQNVVAKMVKAVGTTKAPHPELEAELQHEFAKIEPKVEQGTVTKEEANHLHSLEARAHGHTEKGGLTSIAQSVAARRERNMSLSDASNSQTSPGNQGIDPQEQSHRDKEGNLRKVEFALRPKVEQDPEHVTKEDASLLVSRERRAHGVIEKGSLAAEAQSLADKNAAKESSDTKDTAVVLQEGPVQAADA